MSVSTEDTVSLFRCTFSTRHLLSFKLDFLRTRRLRKICGFFKKNKRNKKSGLSKYKRMKVRTTTSKLFFCFGFCLLLVFHDSPLPWRKSDNLNGVEGENNPTQPYQELDSVYFYFNHLLKVS